MRRVHEAIARDLSGAIAAPVPLADEVWPVTRPDSEFPIRIYRDGECALDGCPAGGCG